MINYTLKRLIKNDQKSGMTVVACGRIFSQKIEKNLISTILIDSINTTRQGNDRKFVR